MEISRRRRVESYRMRYVQGGYNGDHVECHERIINGKVFSFSRIRWASGQVTVVAYRGRTADRLHEWGY